MTSRGTRGATPAMIDQPLKLGRIKLRHLSCALEVARRGSVKQAAESLSVTVSAISKSLRELEAELGVQLFARTRTGMALTEEGRRFAGYAHHALDALHAGVAQARMKGAEIVAVLRLGAMSVVTATLLPSIVTLFLQRHPNGVVDIAPGLGATLLSRLRDGMVDIVLGRRPAAADLAGFDFEELYQDRYAFFVRRHHPFLAARRLDFGRLATVPVVMPPRQTDIARELHDFFEEMAFRPGPRIEVLDFQFSRAYALQSDAVWIASERAAAQDVAAGVLCRLPLPAPGRAASIGIITRRNEILPPHLLGSIDIVREASARYAAQLRDAGQG